MSPDTAAMEPSYPTHERGRLDRRTFFALFGGAVTALTVSSCREMELFSIDLPVSGSLTTYLSDSSQATITVFIEHKHVEYRSYVKAHEAELIEILVGILGNGYTIDDMMDDARIDEAENQITVALDEDFRVFQGESPAIVALSMSVLKLQEFQAPDGGAARLAGPLRPEKSS